MKNTEIKEKEYFTINKIEANNFEAYDFVSSLNKSIRLNSSMSATNLFSNTYSKEQFIYNNNPESNNELMRVKAIVKYNSIPSLDVYISPIDYVVLLYVYEGEINIAKKDLKKNNNKNETKTFSLEKGQCILINSNKSFEIYNGPQPVSFSLYIINDTSLTPYKSVLFSTDDFCVINANNTHDQFLQGQLEFLDYTLANSLPESEYYINQQLCNLLTKIISWHKEIDIKVLDYPKSIRAIINAFEKNYKEYWTLDDLEELSGLNKYKICREFNKYVGISPLQYLNILRINIAAEMLLERENTVNSIAEMVGIPNTNHFINLFTRQKGITPGKYRTIYAI